MNEPQSLEQMLREIETIVQHLEQGNISLEESLKLYERGAQLTEQCRMVLEQAQLTIKNIRQDD
jgi:exodeoxyribonuclease VII small subunit